MNDHSLGTFIKRYFSFGNNFYCFLEGITFNILPSLIGWFVWSPYLIKINSLCSVVWTQFDLRTRGRLSFHISSTCTFSWHKRWIMLFVSADWLVRKRKASVTIYLRVAFKTKSRINSLTSDHFTIYWKKQTNFFVFVRYTVKQLFTSVSLKVVDIYVPSRQAVR